MIKLFQRRPPDFTVGRKGSPYLLRWWLLPRNAWFNVYLHKFLRSDEDRALHDHPWWSLSIILSGGYWEHTKDGQRVWCDQFRIIFRTAEHAHRVELKEVDGEPIPSYSLFITGPRVRNWGFHCPHGWRPWQEFVSAKNSGEVGQGCD